MLKQGLVWLVRPSYKWNRSVCGLLLQPSFCSVSFARSIPLLSTAAHHSFSVLYRPSCVNVPFIYSTFVRHLDSFRFWASINSAGSYTRVCGFWWRDACVSGGCIARHVIPGHRGCIRSVVFDTCSFPSGCTRSHFSQLDGRVPVISHPCQHLAFPFFPVQSFCGCAEFWMWLYFLDQFAF